MRTVLDFSPLHRSSIGFERIFGLLEAAQTQPSDNWPPFDSMKLSEDRYRISMAVAGFKRDEIDNGERAGLTTSERERLKTLERENKELRKTNEILKLASAFFAQAELDRRIKS